MLRAPEPEVHRVHTSRIASAARAIGIAAAVLFAGVPLAAQLGVTISRGVFLLFLLGGLLGLIALVLGLIGIARTRADSGREGRGLALMGTGIGAAIVAVIAIAAGPSRSLPPINDITTDPGDPPEFAAAAALPENQGRDMGYPAGFAEQQRAGYPDLAPIHVARPPAETLDRVAALVQEYGWELTARDDGAGRIEARHTSAIFHFVDDIVVRVRPHPAGSLVDVRSKSRVGQGDLGANAARIRRLRDGLAS
jgi:uncharacterized protein (DUF1499 family)